MSDNNKGRRPIKRVTRDKKVKDIKSDRKDITILADNVIRIKPIRQKPITKIRTLSTTEVATIDPDFEYYLDSKLGDEDRKVIACYIGEPSIKARVLIDKNYHNQLKTELLEYPFWIYVPDQDRKEILKLYLELHIINIQLQAYNRISEAIPEEETDMVLAVMNKRVYLIEEQDNVQERIGKLVSSNLNNLDDTEEIVYVPDEFEDEIDYASAIHQKIVINSNAHTWKKYGREL